MRRKPYTAEGIKRCKCLRCSKPATQQWNVCALGKAYWPVCDDCDIALNKLVLDFFSVPERDAIMAKYKEKMNE